MKRKLGLILAMALLVGCSGGGSAATTATVPTGSSIPIGTTPPTSTAYVVIGVDGRQHSVPAEPDASANKATITGIDSNGDGIRDDVERWIAATWKPGSKEFFAVRQLARDNQGFITDIVSINDVTKHAKMDVTAKAIACAWIAYPGFPGKAGDGLLVSVKEQTLNTAARWKAFYDGDAKMGGAISDGKYDRFPESEVCEGR